MGRCACARSLAGIIASTVLLSSMAGVSAVHPQIRINEIFPNPSGTDTGTERIEIYNAGSTAIDVSGWAIDDAATFDEVAVRARLPEDFDTSMCSGSAIIMPGEYRVIKGTSTNPFLNNSGDDIYLITDRVSVPPPIEHQVTYGTAIAGMVWSAVPNGSDNFAWRDPSLCATNGGAGDVTPPATTTNLLAVPGDIPGEVRLTWTAPGDDGTSGTASEYQIKVAFATINGASFDVAADLERWTNEPLPSPAGTSEELTVFGLDPDSTYFFALETIDDASNESGISNSSGTAPRAGNLIEPDLGFNVYYGTLHSHSSYSDGEQTPTAAYAYARNTAPTPLDFLEVSDHNHSGVGMTRSNYALGLAQAEAANDDGNFVAIYGQEWGLASQGHVNIIESEDLFGWETNNFDVFVGQSDYPGLYDAIVANPPDDYPPIAAWCHPGSGSFGNYAVTAAGQSVVHLIALVNGPAFSTATDESDVGNTNFDSVFGEALRNGWRVSPIGDQDNHNANWGAASETRTGVLATALTKNAILNALAMRRNYATMDHDARVDFSAEGHAMGEAFSAGAGIRIGAHVVDPDNAVSMIELFRGITGSSAATRVAFNENNDEFHWRDLDSYGDGTEAHYYLRVRMDSGNSIWTGPVYVTYDSSIPVAVGDRPEGRLSLAAPYPNPAAGIVSLGFSMPRASPVRLGVYDLSGRRVRTLLSASLGPGPHTLTWNGGDELGRPVNAGVYFVRLDTDAGSVSRKLLYLR